MTFTKEEKQILKAILEKHISEVEKNKALPDDSFAEFGAELSYGEVLKSILKKIE